MFKSDYHYSFLIQFTLIFIQIITDSAQVIMVTTEEAAQALLTEKVEFLRMRISHLTVDYITMKMKHTLRELLQVTFCVKYVF